MIYNKNAEKVIKILFENPTAKFHIRGLANMTKLNPNTIINITDKLEKEEFVVKKKKSYITEIYANIENKNFVIKKRLFNFSQIFNSGIVEFLEREYSPKTLCVIGSYSRGEDIEKSDVDIVVISGKKEIKDLAKFEKKLSRKIHLIITNYKEMSEEFYTNLINGIVLYGYLEKK